jgi:hypothetical protein
MASGSGNIIRGRDATTNEADYTSASYPTGIVTLANGGNAFSPAVYDQSGNGNNATQTTAANQPKLVDAGALIVDGSGIPVMEFLSSRLIIPSSSDFEFGDGVNDFPFSVCMKTIIDVTTSTDVILCKGTNFLVGEYYIVATGGFLFFRLVDNSAAAYMGRGTALSPGEYTMVFTYDGSRSASGVNIYIDGTLKSSTPSTYGTYTAMESAGNPIIIGSINGAGASSFEGSVSAVAIYNKVLTQSEVTQLHNALAL